MEENQTKFKASAVEAYEFLQLMNGMRDRDSLDKIKPFLLKDNKFPYSTDQLEKVLRDWGIWELLKIWASEYKPLMRLYEKADEIDSAIHLKIKKFYYDLSQDLSGNSILCDLSEKVKFIIKLGTVIEAAETKDVALKIEKDNEV